MRPREDFGSDFELLTGHGPFPWQQKLFDEFLAQRFPEACDIPTGLGKTSVIAIWLLALARHAGAGTTAAFPRRLVYVVNRRTVVDQATREAEQMRQALVTKAELQAAADVLRSLGIGLSDDPLAISTLRGQFADNADWRNDPARPAVIVGTVDMVDGVPDHLRRFPCLHVRLYWRDAQGRPVQVPGPVCFGSGRFYGLGLFAAL